MEATAKMPSSTPYRSLAGEKMAGHHLESEAAIASTKERSTAAITIIYVLKVKGRREPMAHKKSTKTEGVTIRENNNEPDANIKRRETLLPSPMEQPALQIFQSLDHPLPVHTARWVY